MRGVGARLTRRADGLHQLLAVIRELEDGVVVIVDDPHVLFGIVGADVHGMGPLKIVSYWSTARRCRQPR